MEYADGSSYAATVFNPMMERISMAVKDTFQKEAGS